jgi:pimeloyl-ACP methyl ester carboxylesterase
MDAVTKTPTQDAGFSDLFVTAQDGLRLHLRSYGPRLASTLPVVCLPGLTRSAVDFHPLATALATDPAEPRRVLTLDYRGRGQSDYDRDPENYTLPTELSDLLAVLTALEIGRAVFVGTSRGGLLAMLLATVRPAVIAGVLLNDIGPVIEPKGLLRIKSYVGKLPTPRSYEEGGEILRRLFAAQFPKFTSDDWVRFAHRSWKDKDGRLVPDYDVRLATQLAGADFERPLPPLWHQFDALSRVPLMVVRGANSDLLSAETVAAMRARRYDIDLVTVPDQGHTPLLAEPDLIHRIVNFIVFCEISAKH